MVNRVVSAGSHIVSDVNCTALVDGGREKFRNINVFLTIRWFLILFIIYSNSSMDNTEFANSYNARGLFTTGSTYVSPIDCCT